MAWNCSHNQAVNWKGSLYKNQELASLFEVRKTISNWLHNAGDCICFKATNK